MMIESHNIRALDMAVGIAFCGPVLMIILICLIYYIKYLRPTYCNNNMNKVSLVGKTVIITGSNSGIGKETAVDLAGRGARIILACRNADKAAIAIKEIKQRSPGHNEVLFRELDLANRESIHKFAKQCIDKETRVDILINNAGIFSNDDGNIEGYDRQIWVNHFGHFLLTHLLLDLLKNSAPSRIINISSVVHSIPKEFIYLRRKSFPELRNLPKYSASKLANVFFTRELARKLESTGVSVFCVHPGYVFTNMSPRITWPIFTSAKAGAQTTIYCAVEGSIRHLSGRYFANCQLASESDVAKDDELSSKIWELSMRTTGLK